MSLSFKYSVFGAMECFILSFTRKRRERKVTSLALFKMVLSGVKSDDDLVAVIFLSFLHS